MCRTGLAIEGARSRQRPRSIVSVWIAVSTYHHILLTLHTSVPHPSNSDNHACTAVAADLNPPHPQGALTAGITGNEPDLSVSPVSRQLRISRRPPDQLISGDPVTVDAGDVCSYYAAHATTVRPVHHHACCPSEPKATLIDSGSAGLPTRQSQLTPRRPRCRMQLAQETVSRIHRYAG
jgi:hypothetical protein